MTNLKRFRKERSISQELLGEKCGLSWNFVAQIETGRRLPSFGAIEKIAKALNIEPYLLFIDIGQPDKVSPGKFEDIDALLESLTKKNKKDLANKLAKQVQKAAKQAVEAALG
ncbi:MAG: helix-turn-helix domain-containing protein [Spirochaetaceae bacterium]|nr:helix-turn-helix domain-containing protein [Spirochaetaceae bacterium]